MVSVCLNLSPLYSKLADPTELASSGLDLSKLPPGIKLRQHQVQTFQAFNDPSVQVVFDTALTGDGKSLAGQLPIFMQDKNAMLLYPTKELIRDQHKGLLANLDKFNLQQKKLIELLFSESIAELMDDQLIENRSTAIAYLFNHTDCILSNPDLFHLLGSYNYGRGNRDKRENVYRLPHHFDYFIFDEFHIFQAPQIISVLNILNYQNVADPTRGNKYVFLSATPTGLFRNLLTNSGFKVREVQGEYATEPTAGFDTEPIVRPVQLHLHKLSDKGAWAWANSYLPELTRFYNENPNSRGVFIVNSVATAKRLTAFFRANLPGVVIGENTSLTESTLAHQAMQESAEAKLIIATSTVDVGVDFRINLLIFESTGAGTFIQRLGRLGRHAGWQNYVAHALLPEWIVDKAAARFPQHGIDSETISRLEFLRAVRGAVSTTQQDKTAETGPLFDPDQEYKNYVKQWAGLQTAHIYLQACGKNKEGKYISYNTNEFILNLKARYNQMYGSSAAKNHFGRWIKDYEEMEKDPERKPILQELNHFRGNSPLTVGIVDQTDGFIKSYDLLFLLANTRFKVITEEEFKRELEKRGLNKPTEFKKVESHNLGIYVRLLEYLEERDNFALVTKRNLKGRYDKVTTFTNLSIADNRNLALQNSNEINQQLAKITFVGLVGEKEPKKFKREKKLTPLFPVYSISGKEGTPSSFVFGLNALLAHSQIPYSLLPENKADDEETLIF